MNAPNEDQGSILRTLRLRRGLSQIRLAEGLGMSERWWREIEQGKHPLNHERIHQVEEFLGLEDNERSTLHLLATGHEAPARDAHREEVPPWVTDLAATTPWPVIVTDSTWDVLAANQPALQHWRWLPGDNVMIRSLSHPETCALLYNWDTDWAPGFVTSLRLAQASWPDDQRLAEVVAESLHSPDKEIRDRVRDLWRRPPQVSAWYEHRRPRALMPRLQPGPVPLRISVWEPISQRGLRMYVSRPLTTDDDPNHRDTASP